MNGLFFSPMLLDVGVVGPSNTSEGGFIVIFLLLIGVIIITGIFCAKQIKKGKKDAETLDVAFGSKPTENNVEQDSNDVQ